MASGTKERYRKLAADRGNKEDGNVARKKERIEAIVAQCQSVTGKDGNVNIKITVGFFGLVLATLVLYILKVFNVLDIGWLGVTAPLWVPGVLWFGIVYLMLLINGILIILKHLFVTIPYRAKMKQEYKYRMELLKQAGRKK